MRVARFTDPQSVTVGLVALHVPEELVGQAHDATQRWPDTAEGRYGLGRRGMFPAR
ncbi:hypothetical protein [Pseudonocardia sp. H11422]|uniref:hypothetical protein n=1 Tax=Pseudonocardia sp. H11422 TaxID=2835866 RepID=UPI001BDCABE0|nr:hypothetical protein [Pseudonocardia sp. H11422]